MQPRPCLVVLVSGQPFAKYLQRADNVSSSSGDKTTVVDLCWLCLWVQAARMLQSPAARMDFGTGVNTSPCNGSLPLEFATQGYSQMQLELVRNCVLQAMPTVSRGYFCSSRAAAPATCGMAMEVPLSLT